MNRGCWACRRRKCRWTPCLTLRHSARVGHIRAGLAWSPALFRAQPCQLCGANSGLNRPGVCTVMRMVQVALVRLYCGSGRLPAGHVLECRHTSAQQLRRPMSPVQAFARSSAWFGPRWRCRTRRSTSTSWPSMQASPWRCSQSWPPRHCFTTGDKCYIIFQVIESRVTIHHAGIAMGAPAEG